MFRVIFRTAQKISCCRNFKVCIHQIFRKLFVLCHGNQIASNYEAERKFSASGKMASFFNEWTLDCLMSGHSFSCVTKRAIVIFMTKSIRLDGSTRFLHLNSWFFRHFSGRKFEMLQPIAKKTQKKKQRQAEINYESMVLAVKDMNGRNRLKQQKTVNKSC